MTVVTATDPTLTSISNDVGVVGATRQDIDLTGSDFISTTQVRANGNLITVPVDDARGLTEYLAGSEIVRACLANNLSYYAYGLLDDEKWPDDAKVCTDHAVRQVARDAGNTLHSVLLGILRAPHFTRRVQDL